MAKLQPDEAFGERHGDCNGEEVSEGVEGGMLRNLQVKSSSGTAAHHAQHTCSIVLSWRAQES
jgi:hypothetical protein